MAKRKIIKIDEKKCTGCGLCIPNCPEGALKIIDKKVRLVSDLFCDGLGACIGHCPEGAISIEEREAQVYDEDKAMENIVPQGPNVIRAHLEHLKDHHEDAYLKQALAFLKKKKIIIPFSLDDESPRVHSHGPSGCPGSKVMDFKKRDPGVKASCVPRVDSQLANWPVQLKLVPPLATYFDNADILIAADCVPFAYANFHPDFVKGKTVLIGCPKLDDAAFYKEKLAQIFKNNSIRSVTCVHMEVPCCFGLVEMVKEAIASSGRKIPFTEETIGIQGGRL